MATSQESSVVTVTNLSSNKEVFEYYKEWSNKYDEEMMLCGYNAPIIGANALAELLKDKRDAKILDVAAGTGCTAEAMMKHGFHNFDALDASREMLDKAKEKNIYEKYILEFLGPNRLNIDSEYYDAVIGTGLFVPNHVGPDCLSELIRITKPGGYAVFAVRSAYLTEETDLADLESTIIDHQDNGKWKLIEKRTVPNYVHGLDGTVFMCQVL